MALVTDVHIARLLLRAVRAVQSTYIERLQQRGHPGLRTGHIPVFAGLNTESDDVDGLAPPACDFACVPRGKALTNCKKINSALRARGRPVPATSRPSVGAEVGTASGTTLEPSRSVVAETEIG